MKPLLVVCTLALAACEQETNVEGTVTINASIAPSTAASLRVIGHESQDRSLAWDPVGWEGEPADVPDSPYTPGTLSYQYRWSSFGPPPPALFIAAFIDLDGDTKLSAGDPLGFYANNPIVDAKEGADAENLASLTIDMVQ